MIRFVHKGRFPIGREAECQLCGTMYGLTTRELYNVCDATVCLNCGTRQCMSNGLGNGSCSICLTGLLLGWSGCDKTCGRVNCDQRAVARAPRIGYGCRAHSMMEPAVKERRDKQFVPYSDDGFRFRQDWGRDFDFSTVRLLIASDQDLHNVFKAHNEAEVARKDAQWKGGKR